MNNTTYNPWTITKKEITTEEARQNVKNTSWDIEAIESISIGEAMLIAEDHEKIKGHDVFFIDFKGHFGYSYVVFYNDHLIRYAGDYELHHNGKTREEIHEMYIKALNDKLFTDEELESPLKNYNDYQRRCNYLNNYYGDRENHVSYFHIFNNKGVEEAYRETIKDLYNNSVCCGYYKSADFVKKCTELSQKIENSLKAMENNFDYWKNAFYHEFFNYECMIGGRYSEAAGAAMGTMSQMNDTQKKAYHEAKREYEKYCLENEI